jgi:hypothetical protein
MTCGHCGATIKDAGAFCSHCGTRLVRPERDAPAIKAATDPARYDLAKASEGYAVAMRHEPKIESHAAAKFIPVVMIGFCIFFMISALSMGGGAFMIPFLVVPGIMIAMAGKMLTSSAAFERAPVVRELRVVVDERVAMSGGGENSSVSTHYYATLQARDGGRREHVTSGPIAGKIAAGDIGIAFLKHDRLVDFLRLEA